MNYFKELLSIEEKRFSTIACLLIITIFYTLYSHYTNKNITSLISIINGLLIAFGAIGGITIVDNFINLKNKIKELDENNNQL